MTAEEIREILEQFFQRGTQTYVGMRYVPIFSGVYDATLEYEPLTMVSYNDYVYVSKSYVPVGVTPTNTDFWFPWNTFAAASITTEMVDFSIHTELVDGDIRITLQ